MPFTRNPQVTRRGTPVLLPDGTTRISLSALAREIGCHVHTLRVYHVAGYRDGHTVLGSLPDPRNVGKRGGRRKHGEAP